jgi:hypothetical protein
MIPRILLPFYPLLSMLTWMTALSFTVGGWSQSSAQDDPQRQTLPIQLPASTRAWIDFKKPADAEQLIGPDGSRMIPENSKIASQWKFSQGVLTASPKWDSVVTPESYQDFVMHLEFNVNDAGDVERERNGNSGLYLQLRYELQILNSFDIPFENWTKTDCGCLYGMKKPDQMACLPAGQWQSFDIAFRAARFENGKKKENARITVYQNQRLIHDDFVIPRHTGAGKKEGPEPMPIKLQGHHNQVQFRNFWIQKHVEQVQDHR